MNNKTYSREVAIVLFLWLGYLSYVDNVEMVKVLVTPIITFNLFAFGFKQPAVTNFMQQSRTASPIVRGRDERSGEHPIGQEQHTDNRSDK